ncbi:hypothetical protein IG631_23197 [Alternaria alternata]|nr:hypothetical protein IG631_23197 [Alternaria alternata]
MGGRLDRNPNNGFPDWYRLVCPELNQAIHLGLHGEYDCDTASHFKKKNEAWFYDAFVKPLSDAQRVQHFHPPGRDLFERLPNEILDQILDHVLPPDCFDRHRRLRDTGTRDYCATLDHIAELSLDFLALGLSSARIWPLVLRRIHRLYQNNWVGRKIGFHRVSARFTSEQFQNYGIKDTTATYVASVDDWQWEWTSHDQDGRWLALTRITPGFSNERALKMWKYDMETRPGDLNKIMQDLMVRPEPDASSGQRAWVLRNLTTQQYVRSDQLQEPDSNPTPDWGDLPKSYELLSDKMKRVGKSLTQRVLSRPKEENKYSEPKTDEQFTLANIFLVLTCSGGNRAPCATPEDPYSPDKYLEFVHGPWAGCAFEVITLDEHVHTQQQQQTQPSPESNAKQPNNVWVDVSREVVADIANLRFCVQRMRDMRNYGHKLYISRDNKTAYTVYWDDFWAKVASTRKLHRQWVVKTCPPRPWIDETPAHSRLIPPSPPHSHGSLSLNPPLNPAVLTKSCLKSQIFFSVPHELIFEAAANRAPMSSSLNYMQ